STVRGKTISYASDVIDEVFGFRQADYCWASCRDVEPTQMRNMPRCSGLWHYQGEIGTITPPDAALVCRLQI
ncbi:hypothetical protein A2U01_0075634, partial [Trifolium medium]|nr:hypothetical protein [Trifolium medium]